MKLKKEGLINNPSFNNFIYTILYNADLEAKRNLIGEYAKAALSEKSAKRFANTATKEEKEYLMAQLGIEFFYVVVKKGVTINKLKDLLMAFEYSKKSISMQAISEVGIFIMSDKEFIQLMGATSLKIHHPNFNLNLELSKQGYSYNKWAKRNLNDRDLATTETQENVKRFCRITRATEKSSLLIQALDKISSQSVSVLVYLYVFNTDYVDDDEIFYECFNGENKITYRLQMKKLREEEYIRMELDNKRRRYSITGRGIKIINQLAMYTFSKIY